VTSSTGLVSAHPFTDGNTYNRVLDAAAAQDALGWRGWLHFAEGEVVAEVSDHDGKPLTGLVVSARFVRPIEPLPEVTLALRETAPGHYAAEAAQERRGQWEVHVTAQRGPEIFELTQRVLVK
jgi:nitrogen fixation protein FixH